MAQVNRRVKADDLQSVSNIEELEKNIAQIGQLQTQIELATATANKQIEDTKEALKKQVKALNDEIKVLHKGAQIFFTANQQDIVPAGKKSRQFIAGEIGTRTPPLSVSIKQGADVVDKLKALQKELQITDLVAVKESVNKPGLIKHKSKVEDIEGITFNQKEQFFIKPNHEPIDHTEQVEGAA